MKRNAALKILNPIIILLFISQALTALLRSNISREVFRVLHMRFGMVFIALVVVHFILNFNWIKASYFKTKARI